MKLRQVNEEFSKEIKDRIVVPMDPVLADDALGNKEEEKAKKKGLKELKKNADDLVKATAKGEKVIDPMLKESFQDGDVQKACDEYLAGLHEDFKIHGKDFTKNAAWNTGHLNMNAKAPKAPEDEKGAGGYWDLAGEIANNICGYVGNGLGKNYDVLQDAIYKTLKYDLNNALKSVVGNKWFNESLAEDMDIAKEKSPEETGIAAIINSLVIDEWEAVDGYQSAIATIEQLGGHDAINNILHDILDEEMVHIGQLQEANKFVEPAAMNIDAGQNEAKADADENGAVSFVRGQFDNNIDNTEELILK